jgi:hypothetical protein
MSSEGCLVFTGQHQFEIYYADHRARLLLGLINYTPPEDPTNKIFAPETPNICLGNFLHLYSREGRVIMTENTVAEQEIVIDKSPSILAVINTFTMPHIPLVLTKKNGSLIPLKVRTHQISEIHMSLLDKYNQPVILLTPMTVVIKIKSLPNSHVQPKTASPKRT